MGLGKSQVTCSVLEDVVREPVVVELVVVGQLLAVPVVQHRQLQKVK